MPCTLFDKWLEFFRLEPWGAKIDDIRFGLLTAAVGQAAGLKIDPALCYSWQRKPHVEVDWALREAQARAGADVIIEPKKKP